MDLSRTQLAPVLLAVALATMGARPTGQQACRADARRLCPEVAQGGGRIAACLKAHELELSSACRAQLDTMRERAQAFILACKPDADRLCKGIPPGAGRIAACLRSHLDELAPACRGELAR
jgi:Golgi apparatus protein 1